MTRSYVVRRTDRTDLSISDGIWEELDPLAIDVFPWRTYAVYRPVTTARLAMGRDRLAIRMQTDEKPLLARATDMNDDVFRDSCMEFFIQPDIEDPRYINFEFNPLGTLLLGIGRDRATRSRITTDPRRFSIVSRCAEDIWMLYWEIPFDFLEEFGWHAVSGSFRGNFYKCGEETEHPHLACWNMISLSEPDFHVPAFFGDFVLSGVPDS
ncbi:MAG: carbohydrate-binding family 9-like protein [Saccharofermentanales bacterium]